MSRETMQDLNSGMILVGNTAIDGNPWWYSPIYATAGMQSPLYPGLIPVDDVKSRLLDWEPVSRRVAVELPATFETMTHIGDNGEPLRWAVQDDRQAMTASDDNTVFQLFKSGYRAHPYSEWLLDLMERIIGGELGITSAGLLRNRGVAWVQVSVPEWLQGPAGFQFRPNLLGSTSLDGTLATQIGRNITAAVCDNTLHAARSERGQKVKVKHSRNSAPKIADIRAAVNLIHQTADDFMSTIQERVDTKVSEVQFKQVLSVMVPIKPDFSPRALTIAQTKRGELTKLWTSDERVAPWRGTALGVLQAFNTWDHHVQGGLPAGTKAQQDASRAERNAWRALHGETDQADAEVMRVLAGVL